MWKNANRLIPIPMHKIQVEMDQRPQYKIRPLLLAEATCLFLTAQTLNNQTEAVLNKSLPSQSLKCIST